MLKLKLQYFGQLMQRADLLGNTLMLGKIYGKRRREWQCLRWLNGITDFNWHESEQTPEDSIGPRSLVYWSPWESQRVRHDLVTEQNIPFGPHNIWILWEFPNQILICPDDRSELTLAYMIKTAVEVGNQNCGLSHSLFHFLSQFLVISCQLSLFIFPLSWFYLYACTNSIWDCCRDSLSNTIMYYQCTRHATRV